MDKVNIEHCGKVFTVAGLIKELKKQDQDKPVFVYGECEDDGRFAKIVHADGYSVNISSEI